MALHARTPAAAQPTRTDRAATASRQSFLLLRTAFTVAPIAFGVDKFLGVLTDWDRYLAPQLDRLVPGSAHQAMLLVGVVEIAAGLLVAVRPAIGGLVVAAWLAGIIANLLLIPGYHDVALRDVGLLLAAVALFRAATAHRRPVTGTHP
ncbi:DoxX family membrane protein [Kineococcus sp. NUM-3379]